MPGRKRQCTLSGVNQSSCRTSHITVIAAAVLAFLCSIAVVIATGKHKPLSLRETLADILTVVKNLETNHIDAASEVGQTASTVNMHSLHTALVVT